MTPDPTTSCGPYSPVHSEGSGRGDGLLGGGGGGGGGGGPWAGDGPRGAWRWGGVPYSLDGDGRGPWGGGGAGVGGSRDGGSWASAEDHDTVGMVVLAADGNLASGTSTNGATHKIPG